MTVLLKDATSLDGRLRVALLYDEDDVNIRSADGLSLKTERAQFHPTTDDFRIMRRVAEDGGVVDEMMGAEDMDASVSGDGDTRYVEVPASLRFGARFVVATTATFGPHLFSLMPDLKDQKLNLLELPLPDDFVCLWPPGTHIPSNITRHIAVRTVPSRKKDEANPCVADWDGYSGMMDFLKDRHLNCNTWRYTSAYGTSPRLYHIGNQDAFAEKTLTVYGKELALIMFCYNNLTAAKKSTVPRFRIAWNDEPSQEAVDQFVLNLREKLETDVSKFKFTVTGTLRGAWVDLHMEVRENGLMQPFVLPIFYDVGHVIAAVFGEKPFLIAIGYGMGGRGSTYKTSDHTFPLTDEFVSFIKTKGTAANPHLMDDMVNTLQRLRIFSKDNELQERILWLSPEDKAHVYFCLRMWKQMTLALRVNNGNRTGQVMLNIVEVLKVMFDNEGTNAAAHYMFQTRTPLVGKKLHDARYSSMTDTYLEHPTAWSYTKKGSTRRNALICLSVLARSILIHQQPVATFTAESLLSWMQAHAMVQNMNTVEQTSCHMRCFLYSFDETVDVVEGEDAAAAEERAALETVQDSLRALKMRFSRGKQWMGMSLRAVANDNDDDDAYMFAWNGDIPTTWQEQNKHILLYGALLPNESINLSISDIRQIIIAETSDDDANFMVDRNSDAITALDETLKQIRVDALTDARQYNLVETENKWRLDVAQKIVAPRCISYSLEAAVQRTQGQAIVRFLKTRPGESFNARQLGQAMMEAGRIKMRDAPNVIWRGVDAHEDALVMQYSTKPSVANLDEPTQLSKAIYREMNHLFHGQEDDYPIDDGVLRQYKVSGNWQYVFTDGTEDDS